VADEDDRLALVPDDLRDALGVGVERHLVVRRGVGAVAGQVERVDLVTGGREIACQRVVAPRPVPGAMDQYESCHPSSSVV
jgi:hypothetical protein